MSHCQPQATARVLQAEGKKNGHAICRVPAGDGKTRRRAQAPLSSGLPLRLAKPLLRLHRPLAQNRRDKPCHLFCHVRRKPGLGKIRSQIMNTHDPIPQHFPLGR